MPTPMPGAFQSFSVFSMNASKPASFWLTSMGGAALSWAGVDRQRAAKTTSAKVSLVKKFRDGNMSSLQSGCRLEHDSEVSSQKANRRVGLVIRAPDVTEPRAVANGW